MEQQLLFLKTLADPTRLMLLKLILKQELCVCELQELLQVSQPAVSQHIAKLKAVGLVKERKAGVWSYYTGDMQSVTAALGSLITFMATDPADLPDLATVCNRLSHTTERELCECDEGATKQ